MKTIFISNRLPVTIEQNGDGFTYEKSIGGLATGLRSYHQRSGGLWVGWPGIVSDTLSERDRQSVRRSLESDYHCVPVFLSEYEIEKYYYGFCNNTIWPLFHYFLGPGRPTKRSIKGSLKPSSPIFVRVI